MYQRWEMPKASRPGTIAMTYTAATFGHFQAPMPPVAFTMTTGRVRCDRIIHKGEREQILAPGRDEIDDDDHDDAIADQWQHDLQQRAHRARAVDAGPSNDLLGTVSNTPRMMKVEIATLSAV